MQQWISGPSGKPSCQMNQDFGCRWYVIHAEGSAVKIKLDHCIKGPQRNDQSFLLSSSFQRRLQTSSADRKAAAVADQISDLSEEMSVRSPTQIALLPAIGTWLIL